MAGAHETAVALEQRQLVGKRGGELRRARLGGSSPQRRRPPRPVRPAGCVPRERRRRRTRPPAALARARRGRAGRRDRAPGATARAACPGALRQPSRPRSRRIIRRGTRRPNRAARQSPPDRSAGDISRSASSRAPPPVTVRSMAFSRLPSRVRRTACARSSRLARVAGSMNSVAPAASRSGGAERRALGDLRLLDIGDGGGRRRPVRRARSRRSRPASRRRNSAPCGSAAVALSKKHRGLRHGDAPEHVEDGPELRVVKDRLRHDDLARVDRARCPQAAGPRSVSASRNAPVEMSIQASAKSAVALAA